LWPQKQHDASTYTLKILMMGKLSEMFAFKIHLNKEDAAEQIVGAVRRDASWLKVHG